MQEEHKCEQYPVKKFPEVNLRNAHIFNVIEDHSFPWIFPVQEVQYRIPSGFWFFNGWHGSNNIKYFVGSIITFLCYLMLQVFYVRPVSDPFVFSGKHIHWVNIQGPIPRWHFVEYREAVHFSDFDLYYYSVSSVYTDRWRSSYDLKSCDYIN
jgi:hypothetical protein